MRESKRKKLEAKGWRIGTPKDFLEMSDEEEAYVARPIGKIAVGARYNEP